MRKITGDAAFPIFCLGWLFIGIYMLATPVKAQDTGTTQVKGDLIISSSSPWMKYTKSKVEAHLDSDELDAIRQIVREEIAAKPVDITPSDTFKYVPPIGTITSHPCVTDGNTITCPLK